MKHKPPAQTKPNPKKVKELKAHRAKAFGEQLPDKRAQEKYVPYFSTVPSRTIDQNKLGTEMMEWCTNPANNADHPNDFILFKKFDWWDFQVLRQNNEYVEKCFQNCRIALAKKFGQYQKDTPTSKNYYVAIYGSRVDDELKQFITEERALKSKETAAAIERNQRFIIEMDPIPNSPLVPEKKQTLFASDNNER